MSINRFDGRHPHAAIAIKQGGMTGRSQTSDDDHAKRRPSPTASAPGSWRRRAAPSSSADVSELVPTSDTTFGAAIYERAVYSGQVVGRLRGEEVVQPTLRGPGERLAVGRHACYRVD